MGGSHTLSRSHTLAVGGVTRAFIFDLILVPASVCGSFAPFVESNHAIRESCIAGCVLALNAAFVVWQTRGQAGLKTDPSRSEAPRVILLTSYILWCFTFLALTAGLGVIWAVMVILFTVAAMLSGPVTAAHEHEPMSTRIPWHVPGVWSFHEDFHLVLAGADTAWLALALEYIAGGCIASTSWGGVVTNGTCEMYI